MGLYLLLLPHGSQVALKLLLAPEGGDSQLGVLYSDLLPVTLLHVLLVVRALRMPRKEERKLRLFILRVWMD